MTLPGILTSSLRVQDKGGEVAFQLAKSLTHHLALGNRRNQSWAKGVLPLLVKGLTLGDLFCKAFGNVFWSHYTSDPIELENLTDYGRAFYYLIDAGVIPSATIVSVLGEAMGPSFRNADKCDRASASDVRRLVDSLGYVLLCIETKAWGKGTYRSLYSTAMLEHAASFYEHKNMYDLVSINVPHLKDPSIVLAAQHFFTPNNNRFIRPRRSSGAWSQSVPPSLHSRRSATA